MMIIKIISIIVIIILSIIYLIFPYIKKLEIKKIIYGGNDKKQIIKEVKNKIQNLLKYDTIPFYEYKDINDTIKYTWGLKIFAFNCYIELREILLNEIRFYTRYIKKGYKNIVIYIGSASGIHIPLITELFPEIKLILIDPKFHNIDEDYLYVYTNFKSLSENDIKQYIEIMENPELSEKDIGIEKLMNIEYLYDENKSYDLLLTSRDYILNKKENDIFKNINNQYDKFIDHYKNFINDIMNNDKRIFIIQDYANIELMKYLHESINKYKNIENKVNILFISNIRTKSFDKGMEDDLNLIWNNIQQMVFMNIIDPDKSMLRFRPPYGYDMETNSKLLKDIERKENKYGNDENYNNIVNDIKKMGKYYDIHNIFLNKEYTKYNYIKAEHIFLQPWVSPTSSEVKFIINKGEKEMISYDIDEWSDKFFYYKYYRSFSYYGGFIDKIRDLELEYDGCQDCSIEISILMEYIGYYINNKDICNDNKEIIKLLEDKDIKYKLKEINNKIKNMTKPLRNVKCYNVHGYLIRKPKYFYLYVAEIIDVKDHVIYKSIIDKDNISEEKMYQLKVGDNKQLTIIPDEEMLINDISKDNIQWTFYVYYNMHKIM